MARKIELLETTIDESGHPVSSEVVHPLTSADCVVMENGATLDKVMGDGIATPTVTHEGASFQVGVGDSNIEVVDGDIAGMHIDGQSYQNILPKPTTLIMETEEKEFKINDKIDNNIVLDDNIAEIATVKGQTYVNVVQEESATEYTVLGEELSGKSITTTGKPEGIIKGATLECDISLVNITDEAHTILIGGAVSGATNASLQTKFTHTKSTATVVTAGAYNAYISLRIHGTLLKPNTSYFARIGNYTNSKGLTIKDAKFKETGNIISTFTKLADNVFKVTTNSEFTTNSTYTIVFETSKYNQEYEVGDSWSASNIIVCEYQNGMETWNIPYFDGIGSVKSPKLLATGKNLFDGILAQGYIGDSTGEANTSKAGVHSPNYMKVKPNTTYIRTITGSYPSGVDGRVYFYDVNKTYLGTYKNGATFVTPENAQYMRLRYYVASGEITPDSFSGSNIQIEEGSTATNYEPYKGVTIEQSIDSIPLTSDMFEQGGLVSDPLIAGMSLQQVVKGESTNTTRIRSKSLIPVKPNCKYVLNGGLTGWGLSYDKNGGYVATINNIETFTTTSNTYYITPVLRKSDNSAITPSDLDSLNLVLQEVPQEIVLRSLPNGVKDTLNLTTGEYIQRIGEVVLDGSRPWNKDVTDGGTKENTSIFYTKTNFNGFKPSPNVEYRDTMTLCDKLPVKGRVYNLDEEGLMVNAEGRVYIRINLSRLETNDVVGFKSFLANNNIKIVCELATPIIHKVNLTNTTKLPSYNSITHYDTIVPSNSLIPTIKLPSTIDYNVAIKPSTQYTIRANTTSAMSVNLGGSTDTLANGKVILTTPSTLAHNSLKLGSSGKAKEVMVIEGSEIKDNVPFFNGMKNVQMGGIKLVNLIRNISTYNGFISINANKTTITYTDTGYYGNVNFDGSLLKPNTLYTLYFKITQNTSTINMPCGIDIDGNAINPIVGNGETGTFKISFTSLDKLASEARFVFRHSTNDSVIKVQDLMLFEGDWTHLDEIPYIESEMIIEQPIIRSQGKNLFDIKEDGITWNGATIKSNSDNTVTFTSNSDNSAALSYNLYFKQPIKVKTGTRYTYSMKRVSGGNADFSGAINNQILVRKKDGTTTNILEMSDFKASTFDKTLTATYTFDNTIESIIGISPIMYSINNLTSPITMQFQIEEGSSATTYEPFKQHTLSSNRVIGYEEGVHYAGTTGVQYTNANYNSVLADVEGLSVVYITNASSNFSFWDKDMVFISGKAYLDTSLSGDNKNGFIQVPSNAKYMKFASGNNSGSATDYTKATVTGELPLRSLPNGVCDSFNLVTGEYVQRVGEIILDGSDDEKWRDYQWKYTNTVAFFIESSISATKHNIICKDFKVMEKYIIRQQDTEVITSDDDNNRGYLFIRINKSRLSTINIDGLRNYLSQNPITVQYELDTPIVRKIGLTAKGNYKEITLNGSENWISANADANNTICTRYYIPNESIDSVAPNMITNSPTFSDYVNSRRYPYDSHGQYEYISVVNNGLYLQVYKNKLTQDSVNGFKQWLSQHPIKVGFLTNQSATTYSNILKPIFFNNINVQFMNNNVDIQPILTLQARSRNSYVMDMMKANTRYTLKALKNNNTYTIDGTSYNATTNGTFTSPSTLTNKLLITGQDVQELMIIEGDVTSKTLPYFKGIRGLYDNVDEIEIYSVNENLFDDMIEIGKIGIYGNNETATDRVRCINYIKLSPNKTYYISCNQVLINRMALYDRNKNLIRLIGTVANGYSFTTSSNEVYCRFDIQATSISGIKIKIELGNKATPYQPHQHNTTLVPMPTRLETVEIVRPIMEVGRISEVDGQEDNTDTGSRYSKDYIPVEPNMILTFMNGNAYRAENIRLYGINKNYISAKYTNGSGDLIIPKDCYFIRFYSGSANTSDISVVKQQYKPIVLNELPNGVKNELIINRATSSAKLIQRVGKVVLDGQDIWGAYTVHDNNVRIQTTLTNCVNRDTTSQVYSVCDKLPSVPWNYSWLMNYNLITVNVCNIHLQLADTSLTKQQMLDWLKRNPITVYYELAEPVITEIRLKGYPFVYEDGSISLNTDIAPVTRTSYNVNQHQLINSQNETIIRHDKQISNLYNYIEIYLDEIYRMELFKMQLELSL